jgi:hypothetical protein
MNIPQNPVIDVREFYAMIATRNKPMLTALEMCIEQLELLDQSDEGIHCALTCARKAVELERGFQERAPR